MNEQLDTEQEPRFRIAGFSMCISRQQFPDLQDYWDGNWLIATARVVAEGAAVEATGSFIRTDELRAFADEMRALDCNLSGKAHLNCIEPNLDLILACDKLGRIEMKVSITPDHLSQRHEFTFGTDQTILRPAIAEIQKILTRYPVKGTPTDR